ncbi:hypothetical protein BBP40_007889, partial [Aspergillus hancockii]
TTTILPILTPVLLLLSSFLSNHPTTITTNTPTLRNRLAAPAISYLLTILPSGLATLALTYLFSPDLFACSLINQWQFYFHNKDSHAIRRIQDRLRCCGLRSVRDRAWPFKDATHGDDACVRQIGYERACIGPWGEEQRSAAWMVVWAAVLVLVVKIASSQLSRGPSWMRRMDGNRFVRISSAEDQAEEGESGTANGATGERSAAHQLPPPGQETYDNAWDR